MIQRDLNARFTRDFIHSEAALPAVRERIQRRAQRLRRGGLLQVVSREDLAEPGIVTSGQVNERAVVYLAFMATYNRLVGPGGFHNDIRRLADAADQGDPLMERFFERHLPDRMLHEAEAVGLSIVSPHQVTPALLLGKRIRDLAPGKPIIWGGPWCTATTDHFRGFELLFRYTDYILRSEGERPFERLLAALGGDGALEAVPGMRRVVGGEIVDSASPAEPELDLWPTPCFDGLGAAAGPGPRLPVLINRGCYWGRCRFCSHVFPGTRHRELPPTTVAAQVQQLVRAHGPTELDLSCHAASHGHLAAISEALVAAQIRLPWSAMIRADAPLEQGYFSGLRRSGCEELLFGLECYPQAELDRLDKGVHLEDLEVCLAGAALAGIRTQLFVLNLPGQSAAAYRRTLDYVQRLRPTPGGIIPQRFQLARQLVPAALGVELTPGAEYDIRSFSLPHRRPHGDLSSEEFFALTLACEESLRRAGDPGGEG